MVKGTEVLGAINKQGTRSGRPRSAVTIMDCGQLHAVPDLAPSGLWGGQGCETMEDRDRELRKRIEARLAAKQKREEEEAKWAA